MTREKKGLEIEGELGSKDVRNSRTSESAPPRRKTNQGTK